MFSYNFQLGLRSLRRNPVLTALMVLGIALGIAASMTSLTLMHVMGSDPIPWKSDKLHYVQLDGWDPNQPFHVRPGDITVPNQILVASFPKLRRYGFCPGKGWFPEFLRILENDGSTGLGKSLPAFPSIGIGLAVSDQTVWIVGIGLA